MFFAQNFSEGKLKGSIDNGKEPSGAVEEPSWTSLVLVEPIAIEDDEQLLFCYRKIEDKGEPNANCVSGRRRYTIEEDDLQKIIAYINELLKTYFKERSAERHFECAKFVTHLAKDIFWGWEEFAAQVVHMSAVYFPQ